MTPEETQRMLDDAQANWLEPVTYTRKRRRSVLLVVVLSIFVAVVCAAASAVVLALLHHDPSVSVGPLITGCVTGITAFIGVGFVQPRSERRRARKKL